MLQTEMNGVKGEPTLMTMMMGGGWVGIWVEELVEVVEQVVPWVCVV